MPERLAASISTLPGPDTFEARHDNLKQRTARGAAVVVIGQVASLILRTGSMILMARLVSPEHFGLVGMAAALTGFLSLFRDAGLAQATVQQTSLSTEQTSTLLWINVVVGVALSAATAVCAPIAVWFYGDPRILWIMVALGSSFLFSGASAQHRAVLQRSMRFGRMMAVELSSLVLCVAISIFIAVAGYGYWALVMMSAGLPFLTMLGFWFAGGWVPGLPRRGTGVRSMVRYGGVLTLNGLVMYAANNLDKVLLGRYLGAAALGIYGRAFQLISLPTDNLNSTIGWVMFPVLAKVQNDPERLRSYFLKGYSMFLIIVAPVTLACGLFAADIIHVMLGSQWTHAAPIFALLAPSILASAVISPLGCLMQASGQAVRSLYVSLMIAPVVMLGYFIGLQNGPAGVAMGFSASMVILLLPVVWWARRGTMISGWDMLRSAALPMLSSAAGAGSAWYLASFLGNQTPFLRLVLSSSTLFTVYGVVLLFVFRQWREFLDMGRALGVKTPW